MSSHNEPLLLVIIPLCGPFAQWICGANRMQQRWHCMTSESQVIKKPCHFQLHYWNACSEGSQPQCKKSSYSWDHQAVGKPKLPRGEVVWPALAASTIPAQAPFPRVKKSPWPFKPQQMSHEEEQRNLTVSQKHSFRLMAPSHPPLGSEPLQLRPQLHEKRDKPSPLCLPYFLTRKIVSLRKWLLFHIGRSGGGLQCSNGYME